MTDGPLERSVPLRAFGPLTEVVPSAAVITIVPPTSVHAIRELVVARHPGAAGIPFRIAVDGTLRDDDQTIDTVQREIALLPPFAGG